MPFLALTGVTGRLGRRVATRLSAAGRRPRLLVRDPARAPELPGCEVVVARDADADAVRAGLVGVDTAFMVSGAESVDRLAQHRTFVDAAADAGVGHLVDTSFVGAGPGATFTLARDHDHIRASGLSWTFLRDNIYLDFLPCWRGPTASSGAPPGTAGWRRWPRTTSPTWPPPCWRCRPPTSGARTT